MSANYYAVIMAGGGGTRLWPLSRKSRPKQMLKLIDGGTLFQIAVERLKDMFAPERILVVTNHEQGAVLMEQCPELLKGNFLLEPEPRGTAPAIGLAAAYLQQQDPDAVMAVLTADHYIGNEAGFLDYLRLAKEIALEGRLVTLGIDPSYAATQYGYIQMGAALPERTGAFEVQSFKEKPDEAEAEKMLKAGGHTWNSGMFVWTVARITAEFERQMPGLHHALTAISEVWGTAQQDKLLEEQWSFVPSQTIDYGVMENAENVAVIHAKELKWNDVGSWNSLFEVLQPDEHGNVVLADKHLSFDTRNTLLNSNVNHMVVTIGVEDLVVVDTGDVLFICAKDRAQEVRNVIEFMKENNLEDYL